MSHHFIIPEASRSNTNFANLNPRPHANGVVGSVDKLGKQLHELSVKQSAAEVAKDATPSP